MLLYLSNSLLKLLIVLNMCCLDSNVSLCKAKTFLDKDTTKLLNDSLFSNSYAYITSLDTIALKTDSKYESAAYKLVYSFRSFLYFWKYSPKSIFLF